MTSSTTAGVLPPRLHKGRLSLLVVGHIANDAYLGFLPPLLPLLVAEMNLSLSLAGLLASTLGFSGALGQPVFGYFADRVRKGWLLSLGPLGGALITLMVYAPNFTSLLVLFLVSGAGSACFHPVASVAASQAAGPRKGLAVSVYIAGGRLGVGLGAAMATFIATRWGTDGIPLAGTVGVAVGLVLIFFAPPLAGAGAARPPDFRAASAALRQAARPLALLWLVNFFRTTVTMIVQTFIPLYVVGRGGSLAAGGWAVTIFLVAAAVGGIYGGHLSDRFGRRFVVIGSYLVGVPALGLMFAAPEPLRTILLALSGAAFYAQMGVSVTYAQEIMPSQAALASALVLGVVWFMSSLGMVGIGALSDLVGIETAFPVSCLALGVAGTILSFWLPKMTVER